MVPFLLRSPFGYQVLVLGIGGTSFIYWDTRFVYLGTSFMYLGTSLMYLGTSLVYLGTSLMYGILVLCMGY